MNRVPHVLLAALVLVVAGCSSVTFWLAPDVTCADWQRMGEENRLKLTEQLIRDGALLEAVRVAQHAPPETTDAQLLAMAISSVTKNCEVQSWSPTVLVKDLVRDLYPPVGS